jgi:hypothetical protein
MALNISSLSDKITKYYTDNKECLHKLFSTNEDLIEGRICHSSIILLYIVFNIYSIVIFQNNMIYLIYLLI